MTTSFDHPTPPTSGQRVIVLGGGAVHAPVLRALANRGIRAILLDPDPAPPAAALASAHVRGDVRDLDAVIRLARAERVAAVLCPGVHHGLVVAAQANALLGTPSTLTPDGARLATDKQALKHAFTLAGVPTPAWSFERSVPSAAAFALGGPWVVKSLDGHGSLGVVRVDDRAGLAQAIAAGGSAGVLVEAFVPGRELFVHGFVSGGRFHHVETRERFGLWVAGEFGYEHLAHGSIAPLTAAALAGDAAALGQRVSDTIGMSNGPLCLQGIATADGRYLVFEVNARLGGTVAGARMIRMRTGFELVEAAVEAGLGASPRVEVANDGTTYAQSFVYARGGVLAAVPDLAALERAGAIVAWVPLRRAGDRLPDHVNSRSRVGAVIVRGENPGVVIDRVRHAMASIAVPGLGGTNLRIDALGLHHAKGIA